MMRAPASDGTAAADTRAMSALCRKGADYFGRIGQQQFGTEVICVLNTQMNGDKGGTTRRLYVEL